MGRRAFWLLVGASAGAWTVVRVQRAAAHLTPAGAADDVRRYTRHLRADVQAALREGRRTRQDVEAGLRAERLPPRRAVGRPIDADASPVVGVLERSAR